jgi:hypothetical protein
MSVVLTLLFFKSLSTSSFMYVPGVEVQQTKPKDVDIIGSCDGHLFLSECKDLRQGTGPDTAALVLSQLRDLVELALRIDAKMVFLSVLSSNLPIQLEQEIPALNKKHQNKVAIHVLTVGDLERGRREKPIRMAGSSKEQTVPCTVYDFLPRKRPTREGWVRSPGERAITF